MKMYLGQYTRVRSQSSRLRTTQEDTTPTVLRLVEKAEDLATGVLPLGLLVVHDAVRRGEDDVAELTRGQQVDHPLLQLA